MLLELYAMATAVGVSSTALYVVYKTFGWFRSGKEIPFHEWIIKEDVESSLRTIGDFLKKHPDKYTELRVQFHAVERMFLTIKTNERWAASHYWRYVYFYGTSKDYTKFKSMYRTLKKRLELAYHLMSM